LTHTHFQTCLHVHAIHFRPEPARTQHPPTPRLEVCAVINPTISPHCSLQMLNTDRCFPFDAIRRQEDSDTHTQTLSHTHTHTHTQRDEDTRQKNTTPLKS